MEAASPISGSPEIGNQHCPTWGWAASFFLVDLAGDDAAQNSTNSKPLP
jgi:hypothetical protein